jgi:hypothetical protein
MGRDEIFQVLLGVKYFGPDAAVLKFAFAPEIPSGSSADPDPTAKFGFGVSKFFHSDFPP